MHWKSFHIMNARSNEVGEKRKKIYHRVEIVLYSCVRRMVLTYGQFKD